MISSKRFLTVGGVLLAWLTLPLTFLGMIGVGCTPGLTFLGDTAMAEVYTACSAYTDSQIQTWIHGVESDRDAGASKRQTELTLANACADSWGRATAIYTECMTCGMAAVRYAYQ